MCYAYLLSAHSKPVYAEFFFSSGPSRRLSSSPSGASSVVYNSSDEPSKECKKTTYKKMAENFNNLHATSITRISVSIQLRANCVGRKVFETKVIELIELHILCFITFYRRDDSFGEKDTQNLETMADSGTIWAGTCFSDRTFGFF